MRRSRSIPGLLFDLATGPAAPALVKVGLVAGFTLIAAGVHGLVTRRGGHRDEARACDGRAMARRSLAQLQLASRGSGLALMPTLASNGDGYGLAWVDGRAGRVDVYFERLGREGQRVGTEVAVTRGPGQHLLPHLAFTGSEYGVAWTDVSEEGDELHVGFARLGADGARRGDPVRLSRGDALQFGASPAWDGSAYGVVWSAVTDRSSITLRFTRVVPGQAPAAEQVIERDALPVGLPAIAWDGREFGVSYAHYAYRRERAEARLLRVSREGRALGTLALGETEGLGGVFAITPAADGLATTWATVTEEGTSTLWFARTRGATVDQPAKQVRRDGVIAAAPSIAWSGTLAGVTWTGQEGGRFVTSFARVSREGTMIGAPVIVNPSGYGLESSLVWNGHEFAVAWTWLEGRARSIRLTRFDAEGRRVGGDVEVAAASAQ
ncbi:MAG: hypothetical protein WCJ30_21015 [Deltaproteobacteria bacterium]